MRLGDSQDEGEFRTRLRDWLSGQIPAGVPQEWDSERLRAWSKSLYQAGYAGLSWPVEHGGRGLPAAYQAIYAEESALAGAPDHVNVIGLNMVGPTIIKYGTQAQLAEFLPGILSGETIFCQGFSEPDAGSDLASVRTRARAHPKGYQVDGEKVWSSYAHLADYCLLLVRTDPEAVKHHGLTCLLMDMRAPGVQVRPLRELSGDTDFNQVILTDVVVGADSVLGPVGQGWRVAMTTLAHERGTFGITLTSRLSAELDRLVQTVLTLGAGSDPLVRKEIAELHVQLQGLRFTGYRALAELQRTGEPGAESSILKLGWSLANQRLTALALRVLGPDAAFDGPQAFWSGYWQQQHLRSRTNSIEGGTSEILRGIVAERVLGLPRTR
ncbi:MAG TPA: acyl-CoA dehydrogenase family protein [Jatrophihabitans sp.]|jgi:alkylation response protein AidB-like acyl-CoA dehydrogenase|uniref:acyl-CoA dehydrogenase family protein n=1 Tax=Jatrophihabitans sp. TaxID=1932789 RepID=UPI002EF6A5F0